MPDQEGAEDWTPVTAAGAPLVSAREIEVFDRSPVGVVISGPDRRIRYANAEAMRLLGVDGYAGQSLDDAFQDRDAKQLLREQLQLRREGLIGSYRVTLNRLSDGRPVHVDITGVPLTGPDGRFIGALGYFRSLDTETLVGAIHRLNSELEDGRKLLLEVAKLLAQTFHGDMVLVTQYSDNLHHANAFFVFRPGQERRQIEWRKRWLALDDAQQEYTRKAETRAISGLREYLEAGVWQTVVGDPLVRAILEEGQVSSLSRIIRRRGAIIGTVSVLSRRPDAFSKRDCLLIDELPIDATIVHVLDFTRQQQDAKRFHLLRELTRSTTVKQACETLARRLVEIFGWSHVSIFRVDYSEGQIHLLAQHSPPRDAILLPDGYQQPITEGILGHLVAERKLLNVGDVSNNPRYIRSVLAPDVSSELCCPISFERDDTVRWIINVEDCNEQAFSDNECEWLSEVAAEVGALMERISDLHFLTGCFRSASDPIVVTGPNYEIRKANPAAAHLLGFKDARDLQGPIAGLFESEDAAKRACSTGDGDAGEFLLRRKDQGEPSIPVHISRQKLPEHLGGTIFVLKDLRHLRRAVELELLGEVTYEVAAQTRTPLAFATAALERLRSRLDSGSAADLDKALRQLGRVKQGYARLALFNRETQPTPAEFTSVDLVAEVRAVVADLPDAEQSLVRVAAEGQSPIVRGDHYQIGFVLETLLAALIRYAPEEEPVRGLVETRNGHASVTLSGYLPEPKDADPATARLGSTVRADVRLARPLIDRFMAAHGGAMFERPGTDGRVQFVLEFPASEVRQP